EPLWPHYVSVVDSGNLAGNLIALKQACIDLPDYRILDQRVLDGLNDTLGAIREDVSRLTASRQRTAAITLKQLTSEIDACAEILADEKPETLATWLARLEATNEHAATIDDIVAALAHEHGGEEFADLRWWTSSLLRAARNFRRDLTMLAPWSDGSSDTNAAGIDVTVVHSLAELPDLCDRAL